MIIYIANYINNAINTEAIAKDMKDMDKLGARISSATMSFAPVGVVTLLRLRLEGGWGMLSFA